MTTTEKKKDRDWTLIGCAGLVVIIAAYSFVTIRVASITEEYRRTYISVLKRNGITSDGKDEVDMVDNATRERCLIAQTTISNNRDKMKNAKYLKPSFSRVAENFFN